MIGLQVRFNSAMKHKNDVRNLVGCLQVVRIYSLMKEIKVYKRASYMVFLFVKMKNNNFVKKKKKRLPRFSPGYEGTENMFYFLTHKYFSLHISKNGSDCTKMMLVQQLVKKFETKVVTKVKSLGANCPVKPCLSPASELLSRWQCLTPRQETNPLQASCNQMESWVSSCGKEGHTNVNTLAERGSNPGPCSCKTEILPTAPTLQ